jgi:hypothetical protein
MSNLALGRGPPSRATDANLKDYPDPAPAVPVPAAVQPRVGASRPAGVEYLTTEDGRALSIETINMLVKENPALVARLIVDAGRRARAELPTPLVSLSPIVRAFRLVDDKRCGQRLSEADADFLAAYLDEISAS